MQLQSSVTHLGHVVSDGLRHTSYPWSWLLIPGIDGSILENLPVLHETHPSLG